MRILLAVTLLCMCLNNWLHDLHLLWWGVWIVILFYVLSLPFRLLPSHSVVFGEPQGDSLLKGTDVMLITAEGQLVELSVPQHLLLRSGRSHSRDLLLLRKLPHAITTGDTDLVMTACDTLQSSRIIVKVHLFHETVCVDQRVSILRHWRCHQGATTNCNKLVYLILSIRYELMISAKPIFCLSKALTSGFAIMQRGLA